METTTGASDDEQSKSQREPRSLSHTLVSQVKQEDLRVTQSSPHRNLELHHTRSFAEIRHLHPSKTDLSLDVLPPRPGVLDTLQK